MRLFDPTSRWKTSELTFRVFGPKERFDHHRPDADLSPKTDPDRGVWYGSDDDLACAIVEVFGDTGIVVLSPWQMARPIAKRTLRLLDLRQSGAMAAGTVAQIAKATDGPLLWRWARWFYEREDLYDRIDGLTWLGAYNDGPCVMLFERAEAELDGTECSIPLAHLDLRDRIAKITRRHNMDLALQPV